MRRPKTMILAAGRGTRLQPLTDHTPKPLIEVGGQPLIERQILALRKAEISEFIVNLSHLGSKIEDFLGNGSRYDARISYSHEPEALETGGALVKVRDEIGKKPFWLHNGDIFTDFDYNLLPDAPPEGADIHLLLTPTPDYRGGDFSYQDGWISGRGPSHVYCGIAVVDPIVLVNQTETAFSFRELMFAAMSARRLSAQVHEGLWIDIGSPEQLRSAQDYANTQR